MGSMRSSALIHNLRAISGRDAVLYRAEDLMLYEYDGGVRKHRPDAVVFPQTADQVARIVKLAAPLGVPLVPRGAGSGLRGGAIRVGGGIIMAFSRMNRIREVAAENKRAVEQ